MKKIALLISCMAVLFAGCAPAGETPPTPIPTVGRSSIQYPEVDPIIHLTHDPALTGRVEGELVPAVANTPDQPFFLVHPAYVQLRFPEYTTGLTFQLPLQTNVPQMMVFQTRDFPGYGGDSPLGYTNQLARLNDLLEKGIDAARCAKRLSGEDQTLPFLPMVNSVQVFCGKAQPLDFNGGKGIRYITYYSQGISPAVDWFAFYTFQGRTEDGQYYLSAVLPVRTNLLPDEQPGMGAQPDLNGLASLLQDQITRINAQPDDQFTPSLSQLDALIAGVKIPGD
jgi:hypothetical protein